MEKINAQKRNFFIKDFFSKCDQILRIWPHLPNKSLMENLVFCAVNKSSLEFFAASLLRDTRAQRWTHFTVTLKKSFITCLLLYKCLFWYVFFFHLIFEIKKYQVYYQVYYQVNTKSTNFLWPNRFQHLRNDDTQGTKYFWYCYVTT